jgi:hypothetical protein
MRNWAKRLCAALGMACLLPLSTRAQEADPAAWGVYAQLLGARMTSEKLGGDPMTWQWDGTRNAIVQTRGGKSVPSQITALGNGKLARHVNGKHVWTGTLQRDGTVVWESEEFFMNREDPYRVRLEGDALVMEFVTLKAGQVIETRPMLRLTGTLASTTLASAAPAASAAATDSPAASLPLGESAAPEEAKSGPRTLSTEELAKIHASMARDKQLRAEALRRQAEEARRQEEVRRQQAEYDTRMATQRAQEEREEREEARRSDDAFASALMGGLNTFKNEMAKNQAERARQQAFVANLQRQQQQANEARQREQDRQRQAAAQEQLVRQQQAAALQQRESTAAGSTGGHSVRPAQAQPNPAAAQATQSPQAKAQAEAAERERQLRENAAADRLRRQQIQDYQLAQERNARSSQAAALTITDTSPPKPAPVTATPAVPTRPKPSADDDAPVMGFPGPSCAAARAGAQRWVGSDGTFQVKAEIPQSNGWCLVQITNWKSGKGTASAQ